MQPAWLVIKIWNHKQKKEAEKINLMSSSIAKLTLLIREITDAFLKQKGKMELDDFLPFSLDSFQQEEASQETVSVYQYYSQRNFIPKYVKQALAKNSNLSKLLDKKR